jgi:hypothetical protein
MISMILGSLLATIPWKLVGIAAGGLLFGTVLIVAAARRLTDWRVIATVAIIALVSFGSFTGVTYISHLQDTIGQVRLALDQEALKRELAEKTNTILRDQHDTMVRELETLNLSNQVADDNWCKALEDLGRPTVEVPAAPPVPQPKPTTPPLKKTKASAHDPAADLNRLSSGLNRMLERASRG